MGRFLTLLLPLPLLPRIASYGLLSSDESAIQYVFPSEIMHFAPPGKVNLADCCGVSHPVFGSVTHDGKSLVVIDYNPRQVYLESPCGRAATLKLGHDYLRAVFTVAVQVNVIHKGHAIAESERARALDPSLQENLFVPVETGDLIQVFFERSDIDPGRFNFSDYHAILLSIRSSSEMVSHPHKGLILSEYFLSNSHIHVQRSVCHLSFWIPEFGHFYGPNRPLICLDLYGDTLSSHHEQPFQGLIFKEGNLYFLNTLEKVQPGNIIIFLPTSVPQVQLKLLKGMLGLVTDSVSLRIELAALLPSDIDLMAVIVM